MAKVGDLIIWGDPDEPIIFRVGYGHHLDQLVDGRTRDEWTVHEQNVRLRDLQRDFGLLAEWSISGVLDQAAAEVASEAGILFAAEEWIQEGKFES
jgi:hypothetical protein